MYDMHPLNEMNNLTVTRQTSFLIAQAILRRPRNILRSYQTK